MRMLLTSGGLRNDVIREALLELLGTPFSEARIVVMVDGILPFSDGTVTLTHLTGLQALGWREFDILSLFGGPPSVVEGRLRSADVILGYGGSNHWLAHAWLSTGFAPLLRELLDEKVYVGWSAGSMIFSSVHERVVDVVGDGGELRMLELDRALPALPLFDWAVLSHLGAAYFPDQTDAWAADCAARLGAPMYFLDDDSALVVTDVERDPEVVSAGHWLRFDESGRLVASR